MELREFLRGWTRYFLVDGAVFVSPTRQGMMRVRAKLPQRRFRALIDEMIREGGPAWAHASVSPLERFTTLEGEHAGLVTLRIATPAGPVGRTVVLIAGDDWSWVVDAASEDPAQIDAFREAAKQMAFTSYLGLGEQRQRRYEHGIPARWIALPRPNAVRYLHDQYPRVRTMITVHDARPRVLSDSEKDDRAVFYDSIEESHPADPPSRLVLGNGMTGLLLKYHTTDRGIELLTARAAILDPRYLYRVHLECALERADDSVAELLAVVGSIVAVPVGRRHDAPGTSTHWAH